MSTEKDLSNSLRRIVDEDFEWVSRNTGYSEMGGYANPQEGARKVKSLLNKYPNSLSDYLKKFDEQYSRRLPKYDDFKICDDALFEIVKLVEVLITDLNEGLIKIKKFNFNKDLNPIEKGLLWLTGIIGISDSIQRLSGSDLNSFNTIIDIITYKEIVLILLTIVLISFMFFSRYDP